MSLPQPSLSAEEYKQHLQTARELLHAYLPMSEEQWEVFKQGFKIRKYKKDDFILNEGDTEKYLSILLIGSTRHYLMVKGEERSFDFSFQHEFSCSYSSFIQQEPSQFCVQTMEESVLASLPYRFLQQLYEQYPESNFFWQDGSRAILLVEGKKRNFPDGRFCPGTVC